MAPDSALSRAGACPARRAGAGSAAGVGLHLGDDDEPMVAQLVEAGWQDRSARRRRSAAAAARPACSSSAEIGPFQATSAPPTESSGSAYSASTGRVAQARAVDEVVGLAVRGIVTEDLRALRDDLDVVEPEGRDEVAQDVGLLPHRVDERPAPLRAGQGEHEARHAATRSEVEAARRVLQAIDQRQGRRARRAGGGARPLPGSMTRVRLSRRLAASRSATNRSTASAKPGGSWSGRRPRMRSSSRRAARASASRRIGLGQEKCSFERPFGLPGGWSASRPALASAPNHPRLPYSVARRSRTVNLTAPRLWITTRLIHDLRTRFTTCG